MLDTGHRQWELFGYDTSQLGREWMTAWRGLVRGHDSPLRARLDEVVCLRSGQDCQFYHSGSPVAAADHRCEALLLEDDLVLTRLLTIPRAAEGDIDAVVAIEVNANSPFSTDDTGYGWQVLDRGDEQLQLVLVIVSLSAVMAYLGREYDVHDARATEVWAQHGDVMVVVRGFGEGRREAFYRRRLLHCGLLAGAAALLLLVIAGVAAGGKRAELAQVEALAAGIQREAAEASEMRTAVATANDVIVAANEVSARYPNPHFEIGRLTRLLGDDVHIVQFAMNGREIRLRGRAIDAASVMQKLTDESAYVEVTAPGAIVKVGKGDLEQFSLNIVVAGAEPG